jgi:hypothetical protein
MMANQYLPIALPLRTRLRMWLPRVTLPVATSLVALALSSASFYYNIVRVDDSLRMRTKGHNGYQTVYVHSDTSASGVTTSFLEIPIIVANQGNRDALIEDIAFGIRKRPEESAGYVFVTLAAAVAPAVVKPGEIKLLTANLAASNLSQGSLLMRVRAIDADGESYEQEINLGTLREYVNESEPYIKKGEQMLGIGLSPTDTMIL